MASASDEWTRIKTIFDAAVGMATADREAYVAPACGGGPALPCEVEALLASHDQARTFVEASAGALPHVGPELRQHPTWHGLRPLEHPR